MIIVNKKLRRDLLAPRRNCLSLLMMNPKKTFPPFWSRIEWLLKRDSKKPADLARFIGISQQSLQGWKEMQLPNRPAEPNLRKAGDFFREDWRWLAFYIDEPASGDNPSGTAVPVLKSEEVRDWITAKQPQKTKGTAAMIITHIPLSNGSFAFEIDDLSMTPRFHPGHVVIIDPKISPKPGFLVLAECDSEMLFRKFRVKGAGTKLVIELVPLNEDWPVIERARDLCKIIGSMVESRSFGSTA